MKNRLFQNTVLYSIGTFLSKIISFVLLPLYTFYLTTTEFGRFDLYNSIVSFAVPVVSLLLSEASFRFLIGENNPERIKEIITNSFLGLSLNIIILFIAILIYFNIKGSWNNEIILWVFLTISNIFFIYFQNLCRGLQNNKQFAVSGILSTILLTFFTLILLVIFKWGYIGLVVSTILSFFFGSIYLVLIIKFNKLIDLNLINLYTFKKMILYSIPLIPNYLFWWVINLSDRLLINYFLGSEQNGVYAIAYRFANILFFAVGVFNLSWQESAILTYNSIEKNKYYSTILNRYINFLFSSILILIPLFPLLFKFVNQNYYNALNVIPILLYSVIFSALSSFYGTAFQSTKKTIEALASSFVGGIVNILANIFFIPHFGIVGSALGTFLSFFIMCVYRMFQTKKYFVIKYHFKDITFLLLCNIITLFFYYNIKNILALIIMFLCSIWFTILMNKHILGTLFKLVLNKVKITRIFVFNSKD
jgi:O-antigen/teichoic acid export membrane protein